MSALEKLEKMKNVEPRVKADGERRRTVSRQDSVGERLAKAGDIKAVAKIATSYGITEEEVVDRAKRAPNFGQFRMVVGNRIRGIERRMSEGMSKKDAAYPPKRTKAGKATKTEAKTTAKKVVKKVAAKPAAKPVAAVKKVAAKATPIAAASTEGANA